MRSRGDRPPPTSGSSINGSGTRFRRRWMWTRWTSALSAMNSAPDDKKLTLLAAIVTHMVEQRSAMNARMEKMQGQMMGHMMQHMQMGKESMSQCPMMEGMKNMDEKSPTSPEDHHDQQK